MSERFKIIAAGIGAAATLALTIGGGIAEAGTYPKASTYDKPTSTCTKEGQKISQCDLSFRPAMTAVNNNG
ncbi:hypothetical protein Mycch_2027 [Mycolicibacterium chubuense NBB4]|uniref:Uncharacterized protein n=1 Tax=Mycolicibacterium chubuense (strain NBB4) TaxID=710421 RepID=I4BHQ3_MYCCN|nr:hypothetical protein [Mycolicibacterium chubuense]AFM16810.1 hypothetical protein Mycch_2027 [Mycolicibacterium chubuense NBB4]